MLSDVKSKSSLHITGHEDADEQKGMTWASLILMFFLKQAD